MDWSSRTSPPVSVTSAATTPPSESFTRSPGTSSAAGTVFHTPSRRTDAVSASRDFSAASVAWARLSWKSPSAALNARRKAMIAASTYLPRTSSSTIAASSIQGTGAQNFSIAMRKGCTLVSGIALGPKFASRPRASSLVRPPDCGPTSATFAGLIGTALPGDSLVVLVMFSPSSGQHAAPPQLWILSWLVFAHAFDVVTIIHDRHVEPPRSGGKPNTYLLQAEFALSMPAKPLSPTISAFALSISFCAFMQGRPTSNSGSPTGPGHACRCNACVR